MGGVLLGVTKVQVGKDQGRWKVMEKSGSFFPHQKIRIIRTKRWS